MLAGEADDSGAIVIINRGLLPFGTPLGFDGMWNNSKICDGLEAVASRAKGPTTQKRRLPRSKASPSRSPMNIAAEPEPMKRLRGCSKKAVAAFVLTWCVRLLPTVPRPVAGLYGSPMPERRRRRVLLNVQEERKTREAG